MWAELFLFAGTLPEAINASDRERVRVFLADFANRIPCAECQAHWAELTRNFPPDLSGRNAFVAWAESAREQVRERVRGEAAGRVVTISGGNGCCGGRA